jgi:hypothetical protein
MPKRWKKEEITYLKRYAPQRTLESLVARFQIEAEAVEAKLSELGIKTVDGMGKVDLADDPVVKTYERGLRAAHAGKWAEAQKLFDKVVADSDLPEVVQRARQYLEIARRQTGRAAAGGDPYLEAVVLHNEGDLDAAEALCKRDGRVDKDERFAYLGAAIAAAREEYGLAAERLETAQRLNPRNRIQAAEDLDFAAMRQHAEYSALFS